MKGSPRLWRMLLALSCGALVACFPDYRFVPTSDAGAVVGTDARASAEAGGGGPGEAGGAADAGGDGGHDADAAAACSPGAMKIDRSWYPPEGQHLGECTALEITTFSDCVATGDAPTCAQLVGDACMHCILSPLKGGSVGVPVLGPLVEDPSAPGHFFLNVAGCVALLDPQSQCPAALQLLESCQKSACAGCLASSARYWGCTAAMDASVCSTSPGNAGDPCASEKAAGAPGGPCFRGAQGPLDPLDLAAGTSSFVSLFCGAP